VSAPQPEVHTAPARSGRWWSSVPRHLGRARTSTIVLAVLWAAIFVLYIAVRPVPAVTGSTTGNPTGGVQPAPTATAPRTTTAHPTTAPPTTTPARTTPTGSATMSSQTTSPTDTATASTTPTATPAGPTLPTGGGSPST